MKAPPRAADEAQARTAAIHGPKVAEVARAIHERRQRAAAKGAK